tara:strand:- start:457 stop:1587 length:1131 start_codon:yes stop_codon:yes gene_type:complete
MSDSERPFDHEWSREHVRRADTPRVHEAYRQMCEIEGDIPPLVKGNLRFWPSDDDFRKAWRVDEEGIWLPQKLLSDWPDIFWRHVVPRLDLESTLSLGQASVECRERVWGKVRAEHLHEKVLYNFLERSIAFEERVRTRNMIEELDRSIVWDFDIKRPNTPVETSAYAWWPMVVKALHKEAGDGVDQTGENYRDPMYMAIHNNQVDVIVLLIHAGFEIECDHLVYAVKYDRLPALTALLRHGPRGVANVQDKAGNTVLHRMASMEDEQDFYGLLSFNHLLGLILSDLPPTSDARGRHVDPKIENNDGEDAREVAYGYENGTNIVADTFLLGYSEWTVWYAWYLPKLPNCRGAFECINYEPTDQDWQELQNGPFGLI